MAKAPFKDNMDAVPEGWPPPSPEALAHSRRLAAVIGAEIERAGPMDFARFMELALYAPGLGYYSAGAQKFGAAGDFITAPELSPLFAECLARQLAQALAIGDGDTVFELGAGSGVLAADCLRVLSRLDALPDRYWILEPSAELRARQRDTIRKRVPGLLDRVSWLDRLPEPAAVRGVIFANEVMDALPVHCFQAPDRALSVGLSGEGFEWVEVDADGALRERLQVLDREYELAPGYRSEWSPRLGPWIASLADCLSRGLLLLIDYGMPRREYYHPDRTTGTLMCHYRHRAHDNPFLLPGLQDITAHVDFTAVAEVGLACDLDLLGYTTQAHFLIGSGLEEALAEIIAREGVGSRAQLEAASQTRLLTLPGEMGERFKAIVLGRGIDAELDGFRIRDLSPSLSAGR